MEKGLIHIYCGDGKGKTTAVTGLAVRCAGCGGKVLWFQFLKRDTSGERKGLSAIDGIELLPGYDKMKFTFRMTEEEKQEAKSFFEKMFHEIETKVHENEYDLLVMDEVIGAVNAGMIKEEELLQFLKEKPEGLEVALTGRNPSNGLVDCADYVSNIQKVKHPYDRGIGARRKYDM